MTTETLAALAELDDPHPNGDAGFEPAIVRLSRDLMEASASLGRNQARYAVDAYYQVQDFRKANFNQVRQLQEGGEPSRLLEWLGAQHLVLEGQLKRALGRWAGQSIPGKWLQSICGIGPVISAGLLAHLDDPPPPSVSHWWRFGGLDPSVEWKGTNAAREMVNAAWEVEESPQAAIAWLAKALNRHTADLFVAAGAPEAATREQALAAVIADAAAGGGPGTFRASVQAAFDERPMHVDNAIRHACAKEGLDEREVYEALYPEDGYSLKKADLIPFLAKRPWNADLKCLLWKVGESFVKVKGLDSDYYGKLYTTRKAWEQEKNDRGGNREYAQRTLAAKRIGATTEAYKAYADGRCPPMQVHGRARRWVVKILLAHIHEVIYFHRFELPAPGYAFEHLGHVDRVPVPNMELVPGLAEARAKAGPIG